MSKSKPSKKNLSDPTKKLVYLSTLLRRVAEEKSNFAKVIFQENFVTGEIIATINALGHFTHRISNSEIEAIERSTLGQQRDALYRYFHTYEEEIDYRHELDGFIKERNRITHKMFSDFEDMPSLENACKDVVLTGDILMKKMNDFRVRMFNRFLDGVIKSI